MNLPTASRAGSGIASNASKECVRPCNLFCLDANLDMAWALATEDIATGLPGSVAAVALRPSYNTSTNRLGAAMAVSTGGIYSTVAAADYEKALSHFGSVSGFVPLACAIEDDDAIVFTGNGGVVRYSAAGVLLDAGAVVLAGGAVRRIVAYSGGYIVADPAAIHGIDLALSETFNSGITFSVNHINDFATDGSSIFVATTDGTPAKNVWVLDSSASPTASALLGSPGDTAYRVVVGTDGNLFWGMTSGVIKTDASLNVLWSIAVPIDSLAELAPAPSGGVYVTGSFSSALNPPDNVFHYDASGALLASTRIGYTFPGLSIAGGDNQNLYPTSKPDGSRLFIGGLARYFRWQGTPA